MHDTFSFQCFICCTNKIRVVLIVHWQAWNKYTFYSKSNTFSRNIDGIVCYKILLDFWIYDPIDPLCKTTSILHHYTSYLLLCSTCVAYGMLCHTIGHQMLLNSLLGRQMTFLRDARILSIWLYPYT